MARKILNRRILMKKKYLKYAVLCLGLASMLALRDVETRTVMQPQLSLQRRKLQQK